MNTRRHVLTLISAMTLSGSALASGWEVGTAPGDGWNPGFTLAGVGGELDADYAGKDLYTGLEFSFNCLLLRPPKGAIRQQFNIGTFDDNGLELTSYEWNPNYFMTLAPGLTLGFGPGVGYVTASWGDGPHQGLWGVQASANLNYRRGPLFLGAGARYQDTRDKHLAPGVDGADNVLLSVKAGLNL